MARESGTARVLLFGAVVAHAAACVWLFIWASGTFNPAARQPFELLLIVPPVLLAWPAVRGYGWARWALVVLFVLCAARLGLVAAIWARQAAAYPGLPRERALTPALLAVGYVVAAAVLVWGRTAANQQSEAEPDQAHW